MQTANLYSRRRFVLGASLAVAAGVSGSQAEAGNVEGHSTARASAEDVARMRALAASTVETFKTDNPIPYGAAIYRTTSSDGTKAGEPLVRAVNTVGPDHDPSSHGEVHAMRLGCSKLGSSSLRGYTLYTTCEPCPMCMACALWAGVDRVVYGATIADAAQFGRQIMIPAREVARAYNPPCRVDGPVERETCLALFTNPAMQKVYARWAAVKH